MAPILDFVPGVTQLWPCEKLTGVKQTARFLGGSLLVQTEAGHSLFRSIRAHVDCCAIRPTSLQPNWSALVSGDYRTISMSHGQNMMIGSG